MTKEELKRIITESYTLDDYWKGELPKMLDQLTEGTLPPKPDESKFLFDSIRGLMDIQNPYRTITCSINVGQSKKDVLLTFLCKDFVRMEDGFLILRNDERRLKLPKGQQGVIERQLCGESKI